MHRDGLPYWINLAALFAPFALISLCWWVRARLPRRPASRRAMHCRGCGYDCSGIWPTALCPECGRHPVPGLPLPPAFLSSGSPLALLAGPAALGVIVAAVFAATPIAALLGGWARSAPAYAFSACTLASLAGVSTRMRPREWAALWACASGGSLLGWAAHFTETLMWSEFDSLRIYAPEEPWIRTIGAGSALSIAWLLRVRWARRREALREAALAARDRPPV